MHHKIGFAVGGLPTIQALVGLLGHLHGLTIKHLGALLIALLLLDLQLDDFFLKGAFA